MEQLIYKDESYKIIGCCFEVHKTLGKGFSEIIYKEALEHEFRQNSIPYVREKPVLLYIRIFCLKKDFILILLCTIK